MIGRAREFTFADPAKIEELIARTATQMMLEDRNAFKNGLRAGLGAIYLTLTKEQIGPWLPMDSHDEVRAVLCRGNVSAGQMEEREKSIRRWGVSSVALVLTEQQIATLIKSSEAAAGPGMAMNSGC
jgi:hypothetical protein